MMPIIFWRIVHAATTWPMLSKVQNHVPFAASQWCANPGTMVRACIGAFPVRQKSKSSR
jgi:hypothetical protein